MSMIRCSILMATIFLGAVCSMGDWKSSYFCKIGCRCSCDYSGENCAIQCDESSVVKVESLYDKSNFNVDYYVKELKIVRQDWTELVEPIAVNDLVLLDLSSDRLVAINKSVFMQQFKLKALILRDNLLVKIHPDAFKNPKIAFQPDFHDLSLIDLTNNQLSRLDAAVFANLIKLSSLNLSGNPLKQLLALQSCANLKTLNLSRTQIDDLPGDLVRGLIDLIKLDVSGNYLKGIPKSLGQSGVRELILDDNPIGELELFTSGFPANLTRLRMCFMSDLTTIGEYAFGSLTNLSELHLCNNPRLKLVDKLAFRSIDDNNPVPIKKLFLENNSLERIGPDLLDWDALEFFNLTGNPWKCDCNLRYLLDEILPLTVQFRDEEQRLLYNDDNTRCASPAELAGKSLYEIVREDVTLTCESEEYSAFSPGEISGLFFATLLGVLMAGFFAYFAYSKLNRRTDAFSNFFVRYTRQADEDETETLNN